MYKHDTFDTVVKCFSIYRKCYNYSSFFYRRKLSLYICLVVPNLEIIYCFSHSQLFIDNNKKYMTTQSSNNESTQTPYTVWGLIQVVCLYFETGKLLNKGFYVVFATVVKKPDLTDNNCLQIQVQLVRFMRVEFHFVCQSRHKSSIWTLFGKEP